MQSRLYISGYWPLIGNVKHSADHYQKLLPRTLMPLRGSSLKFFSDDESVLDWVVSISNQNNLHCEPFLINIDDLPAWSLAGDMVRACERTNLDAWPTPLQFFGEKGSKHYWRDFKGSGPMIYRKLLSIWMSKISIVAAEARRLLDGSDYPYRSIAWMDASLARFNRSRRRWRYWKVRDVPNQLSHYRGSMRCFGVPLPIQASFLTAEVAVWPLVENLFLENALSASSMAYAHDEETVMAECCRRQPLLFNAIDMPFHRRKLQSWWGKNY